MHHKHDVLLSRKAHRQAVKLNFSVRSLKLNHNKDILKLEKSGSRYKVKSFRIKSYSGVRSFVKRKIYDGSW